MKLKLIIAFLPDARLEDVLVAARKAGATGSTIITSARGEGIEQHRSFLGFDVTSHRNLVLWLVNATIAPSVLREVSIVGRLDTERGAGIACQIDVEEAAGFLREMQALQPKYCPPAP